MHYKRGRDFALNITTTVRLYSRQLVYCAQYITRRTLETPLFLRLALCRPSVITFLWYAQCPSTTRNLCGLQYQSICTTPFLRLSLSSLLKGKTVCAKTETTPSVLRIQNSQFLWSLNLVVSFQVPSVQSQNYPPSTSFKQEGIFIRQSRNGWTRDIFSWRC